MAAQAEYDSIGRNYALHRRPDPRIAARLTAALGDASSVLNVGAGSGNYEPSDRHVIAVEPSAVMVLQRAPGAAPAVQARAEALPFADGAFDATMAVLTIHHWSDRARGLAECARVARERVVVLTWDPAFDRFWLLRDYFPEFVDSDRKVFPPITSYVDAFGPEVQVAIDAVPVPHDSIDGFLGAYWARPAAYLDPAVRAGMSSFARPGMEARLARLSADLASGVWHARNGHLLEDDALDLGYRLVVAHFPARAA